MRWLAVLAVTIIAGLVSATPTVADSPSSLSMVHAYDAMTYDRLTASIAPLRGPPAQAPALGNLFGVNAVDPGSQGVPTRPATSGNCNYTTYDQLALLAQFGSATTKTASSAEPIDGDLSLVRQNGVAANTEAGSIRGVNPLRGSQNCVNCAIATDSTLSGAPMSALNFGPQPISVLEKVYGGTFKSVAGRSQIEQMLAEAGPGARGIVFGSRGIEVDHVFNAVNQRGAVRFLDGQSGGAASFDGFDGFMFLRTN